MDLTIKAAFAYHGPPSRAGVGLVYAPPFYAIWHVDSGEAKVVHGRRSWICPPGSVLVVPPCWRRMQQFRPKTILVSIGLIFHRHNAEFPIELNEPRLLDGDAAVAIRAAACEVVRSAYATAQMPLDMQRAVAHRADVHLFASVWLQRMLAAGIEMRVPTCEDARLEQARTVLLADPRIGPIPYGTLRRASGLGRSQIDRLFRLTYGLTPRQVRDRATLDRIQSLMVDPQRNIAGIATQVGASSTSHFVRWYRRLTGHTPGRTRRDLAACAISAMDRE